MLCRLLLLVAVLLMPFGMAPVLASQHQHSGAAMPMQHCPEQTPSHSGKAGFTECAMACSSALPAAVLRQREQVGFENPPQTAVESPRLRGIHPDIATPPPRSS